jgi:hypothetical protein
MDTEGSDISTSLATDPEDTHISLFVILEELGFIDSSNSKLFLNSRDKWWSLETGTS